MVVNSADPAVSRLGDTVYALDEGTPITIDLNTGQRHEWSTSGIAPADAYRLLADGPAHRLWLVGATPAGTVVEFLDPTTMAVIGRHQAGGNFMDAAALSGRLYLATTTGVSTLPAAGEPVRPPALGGRPLLLAADPVRQRLLAVVLTGRSIRITAWLPGRDRPAVTSPSPIGKGNLVTAGGHVWVAGFGRRAVLAELDPATLRVDRRSRLAGELGAGALIVDAAARHLLVRAGAASGPVSDLWCVDAANGKVVRHWSPASGSAVLTDRGVDLLSPGRPLIRLPSGACRG